MTSGLHRSGPKGRRPGLGLLKDRRDNRGGRNTGSRRRSWRSSNGIFRGYWNCRRIRFWRHGSNGRSDLSLSEVLAGRSKGSRRPLLWRKITTWSGFRRRRNVAGCSKGGHGSSRANCWRSNLGFRTSSRC